MVKGNILEIFSKNILPNIFGGNVFEIVKIFGGFGQISSSFFFKKIFIYLFI
jgi:hypothetical protein